MKYGLAAVGLAMVVTGVIVALVSSLVAGIAIMVIGLFPLAMGLSNWHELEAQVTRVALKLRLAKAPTPPPAPAVEPPRPDIRILDDIKARGGDSDFVDFSLEVANYGTQQCRCTVRADVDGTAVECRPSSLDLIPNDSGGPKPVRVLVPRPALGNLMLPWIQNETTLYDRTLTVAVCEGEYEVTKTWHETVFSPDEDRARAEAQARIWRSGLGQGSEEDFRAEAQAELLRRHEERVEGEP